MVAANGSAVCESMANGSVDGASASILTTVAVKSEVGFVSCAWLDVESLASVTVTVTGVATSCAPDLRCLRFDFFFRGDDDAGDGGVTGVSV